MECELTQFTREKNATVTIDIHLSGITDHQPLQAASLRIEARQAHQFSFYFFPVRERIEEEAVVLVDGSDQLTIATRSNPLPITGRNGQTPFGVQSDFGSPTQHDFDSGSDDGTRYTVTAFTPSSHFSPLFTILFGPLTIVNR